MSLQSYFIQQQINAVSTSTILWVIVSTPNNTSESENSSLKKTTKQLGCFKCIYFILFTDVFICSGQSIASNTSIYFFNITSVYSSASSEQLCNVTSKCDDIRHRKFFLEICTVNYFARKTHMK